MLLENLYRVFLSGQEIALEDARTQKIIWRGLACGIPIEYLNYVVSVVMSCVTTNKIVSEILIIIA